MGEYDFSYKVPSDFGNRIKQILTQIYGEIEISNAFDRCTYEYEDVGFAYYAGMKGDNWNKKALDFIFEGSKPHIDILKNNKHLVKEVVSRALKSSESGFLIHNILFLVVEDELNIPISNDERLQIDLQSSKLFLKDLISIGERLCLNAKYTYKSTENEMNDYFRDNLLSMDYKEVKDQSRHGISLTGKSAGEVDILISQNNKEVAIFEGLKLDSVNTSYIENHITKSIINYNALGTATFIVGYIGSPNFKDFCRRYNDFLRGYCFPLKIKQELKELAHPNASTRVSMMILSRDGYDFPVYFLNFRVN